MGLDIFCDVVVERLCYCAPMNELHVLEVEKVYWKYILNVLIDGIMDDLKEIILIKDKASQGSLYLEWEVLHCW